MTFSLSSSIISEAIPTLLAGAPGGMPPNLLLIIGMFAVVWFMLILPSRKEEKQRRARLESLERGSKVVLTGGILGRVSSVDDKIAVVEIADKVKVRVLKKDIADLQEHALKDDGKGDSKADSKKESAKEVGKGSGEKASDDKKDKS